jgi:hypothetical protein
MMIAECSVKVLVQWHILGIPRKGFIPKGGKKGSRHSFLLFERYLDRLSFFFLVVALSFSSP